MAIRSRLDQDEERFIYPGQPKFGSLERSSPSASTPRMGRRSPRIDDPVSASASPLLKAKDSANDMIFDMDDEQNKRPSLKTRRLSTTSSTGAGLQDVPEAMYVGSLTETGNVQSFGVSQGQDQDVSFSTSQSRDPNSGGLNINVARGQEVMDPVSTTSSLKTSVAWDSSRFQTAKVDMKELLGQASSTRTSNISLGIAAKADGRSNVSFSSKLSQKERKRLQQQYQQQESQPSPDARPQNTNRTVSDSIPKSPWQTPVKGHSVLPKDVPYGDLKSHSKSPEVPSRAPSKTPLTMRQTIPGKSSPQPTLTNPCSRNTPVPAPERPTSSGSAGTAPVSAPSFPLLPSQSSLTPQIQSIRHTPAPKPSPASTLLSMADILAQQQSEKDTIREVATAKRSLQEIQQEQEFQEWWDQEAAKVKAEQDAADAAAARVPGAPRGRGKARGRGRGRGGGAAGRVPSGEGKERGKGDEGPAARGARGKGKEAAS
jgi:hypothetical protein